MSYPAEGKDTLYRNDCRDVSFNLILTVVIQVKKFLDERHGDKYWVFNVSEKPYEKSRFDGKVSSYGWLDHTAPPFHLLLKLV